MFIQAFEVPTTRCCLIEINESLTLWTAQSPEWYVATLCFSKPRTRSNLYYIDIYNIFCYHVHITCIRAIFMGVAVIALVIQLDEKTAKPVTGVWDCASTFVCVKTTRYLCFWQQNSTIFKPNHDLLLNPTKCFWCLNLTGPWARHCHDMKLKIKPKEM